MMFKRHNRPGRPVGLFGREKSQCTFFWGWDGGVGGGWLEIKNHDRICCNNPTIAGGRGVCVGRGDWGIGGFFD